eukprot:TRINITY_DN800_c2_g1_i1.p1 TRINITY_DN800_c2_g1~~TRINITY_DN800_c2_g1_i1.p1  ORF type:complete len:284 (+),score=60.52 TRINITY_DN800_c2_g1_i1:59-910(+)
MWEFLSSFRVHPSNDPIMGLLGWEAGRGLMGCDDMLKVAPFVALTLFIAVHVTYFLVRPAVRTWEAAPGKLSGDDLAKEVAFGVVGIMIHCYMGPAAFNGVLNSNAYGLSHNALLGHPDAFEGHQEWIDISNANSCVGFVFTGYAFYITVMWCLGWEHGKDKIAHHIVFLSLALLLSGTNTFSELAVYAMSMELSTIPLNVNHITAHIKSARKLHLASGLLFIISFVCVRIFFFGYGLARNIGYFVEDPTKCHLPFPVADCVGCFLWRMASSSVLVEADYSEN